MAECTYRIDDLEVGYMPERLRSYTAEGIPSPVTLLYRDFIWQIKFDSDFIFVVNDGMGTTNGWAISYDYANESPVNLTGLITPIDLTPYDLPGYYGITTTQIIEALIFALTSHSKFTLLGTDGTGAIYKVQARTLGGSSFSGYEMEHFDFSLFIDINTILPGSPTLASNPPTSTIAMGSWVTPPGSWGLPEPPITPLTEGLSSVSPEQVTYSKPNTASPMTEAVQLVLLGEEVSPGEYLALSVMASWTNSATATPNPLWPDDGTYIYENPPEGYTQWALVSSYNFEENETVKSEYILSPLFPLEIDITPEQDLRLEVQIEGEWVDQTGDVVDGTWQLGPTDIEIGNYRIVDQDDNVVLGPFLVPRTCDTDEPIRYDIREVEKHIIVWP